MKVLFDEGVPRQLVSRVTDHGISTVKSQGWLGIKNGTLLALLEVIRDRVERQPDYIVNTH